MAGAHLELHQGSVALGKIKDEHAFADEASDVSTGDSSTGALTIYGEPGDQILLADILVERLDAATFVFELT